MGGSLLDDLKAWKRRIDEAAFDNEPVYVTPEEYLDLRRVFAAAEDDLPKPREGRIGAAWVGRALIVDSEKADEQRRRWGWR